MKVTREDVRCIKTLMRTAKIEHAKKLAVAAGADLHGDPILSQDEALRHNAAIRQLQSRFGSGWQRVVSDWIDLAEYKKRREA